VSDKPGYLQAKPRFGAEITTKIDALRISQYEALLAVDEAVGRIVQALDQAGRLSNTLIVFTSDNGLTWGEHRISLSKNLPYEESIRVPLIMRYDGLIPSGVQVSDLVANIDLAPTFVRLAGATAPPMDGRSLVPLFDPGFEVWRDRLLIEHGALQFPAFCQIRFERFSYVLYQTGEEELYGLSLDPHQLSNVAPDGRYDTILDTARSTVEANCQPRPPGFRANTAFPP
jgi:arylsulfatase A-like enzyme